MVLLFLAKRNEIEILIGRELELGRTAVNGRLCMNGRRASLRRNRINGIDRF